MVLCTFSHGKGDRNEGWFDPWLLVRRLRNKAHVFGANFVVGNVTGFTFFSDPSYTSFMDRPKRATLEGPRLNEVVITTPDGNTEKIACHAVVNAAGAWSGDIMKMALLGTNVEVIPLPVEKR